MHPSGASYKYAPSWLKRACGGMADESYPVFQRPDDDKRPGASEQDAQEQFGD